MGRVPRTLRVSSERDRAEMDDIAVDIYSRYLDLMGRVFKSEVGGVDEDGHYYSIGSCGTSTV